MGVVVNLYGMTIEEVDIRTLYKIENKKVRHKLYNEGYIKRIILDTNEINIKLEVDFKDGTKKFLLDSIGKHMFFCNDEDNDFFYNCYLENVENIKTKIQKNKIIYDRKNFLNERKIEYLVHFTNLKNLESIMKNGVLSKQELEDKNMLYYNTDGARLDNQLDYISTSITFPNYKMFCKKREEIKSQDWVILKIDSQIICDKLDTLFLMHNCSDKEIRNLITQKRKDLEANEALKKLFNNYVDIKGIRTIREDKLIDSNMTTNPQAEVMIKKCIEIKYIKAIVVIDDKTKQKVKEILGDTVRIEVDNTLFSYREDYNNWRSETLW